MTSFPSSSRPTCSSRPFCFSRHCRSVALLLAASLSGCTSWLGAGDRHDRPTLYAPEPQVVPVPDWPHSPQRLLIARPTASRILDSTRVLVRPDSDEIQVLRGALWVQPPPEMLQTALLRVLEDAEKLRAVARQGTTLSADQTLILDIRRFDVDYRHGTPPVIEIALTAKLIGHRELDLIASGIFTHSEPATGTETDATISAFQQGLTRIVQQLAEWVLTASSSSAGHEPKT